MPIRHTLAKAVPALLCLLAGSAAQAQYGLQWGSPVPDVRAETTVGPWALELRLDLDGPAQVPLRLRGDHYLTGPGLNPQDDRVRGGLRVSSGLALSPQSDLLPWGPRPSLVVLPYLGLGYTRLSVREGWGFSADIGLGGLRDGSPVHFGLSGRGGEAVERLLDELRLAPVVQVGVSYAF